MNREPLALAIFRYLLLFGLVAFMAMLYWSSLLLEEQGKQMRSDLREIKREISSLQRTGPVNASSTPSKLSPRSHIDPSLPNLLKEDPFYLETLPKLLGPDFKPHGTFQGATVGRPDNLHPFSNWAEVSSWISLCTPSLARSQFGKYETLSPDLAVKIEERPSRVPGVPEFWVHLREGVFWQPLKREFFSEEIQLSDLFLEKHPVTAHDFKFYFDILMNPYNQTMGAVAQRNYYGDVDEIEVVDPLTFIVRWKAKEVEIDGKKQMRIRYIARQLTGGMRPLASFLYQYFPDGKKILEDDQAPNSYRTSSVFAQNLAQHWAKNIIPSCGPWAFTGLTERQISFRRNPDHYFPLAALAEEMIIAIKDSADSIWQDFEGMKSDTFSLPPDKLIELKQFLSGSTYKNQKFPIEQIEYLSRSYIYIGWNEAKPYFTSAKVRRALTMAIDRQRIIRDVLHDMGVEITGTFFRDSPSYDPTIVPLPFDPQKARRALEEEGWFDRNGDGILDKEINGKRVDFEFSLTYYVKNPTSKIVGEYVATALKEIGVICNLNGVDIADLSSTFDDKNFDAILLGWSLSTPPEEPRQLWSSAGAKEKGSSNAIGFSNAEIDKIIEKLQFENDKEKRTALYHQFDKILYQEQPYTFLYTPKTRLLYRQYLQNVFIPADRQDLVPGANVSEPDSAIFWIKK